MRVRRSSRVPSVSSVAEVPAHELERAIARVLAHAAQKHRDVGDLAAALDV